MERTTRIGIILKYTNPNTFNKFNSLENLLNVVHHNEKLNICYAYTDLENIGKIKNVLKKIRGRFEIIQSELFKDQNLNFSLDYKENQNTELLLLKDPVDLKNIKELQDLEPQIDSKQLVNNNIL